MLSPLAVFMAAGIYFLISLRNHHAKLFKILLITLFSIQLPLFLYRFYLLAPNLNTSFWSYSAKKAAETALENKNNYNHIILSANINDVEFAYPVYAKIDPKQIHYQNSHKTYFGEFQFLKYDNVYIGSIPSTRVREIMNSLSGTVLYLGTIEDRGVVDNERVLRNKDDSPLFVVSHKN